MYKGKQILVVLGSLLIVAGVSAKEISLEGSDIIQPLVVKAQQDFKGSGIDFKIEMAGSFPALRNLENNDLDIAIVAIRKDQETPQNCEVIPLCYQVSEVIVNEANPIEMITTQQLYDIYSEQTRNRAFNWQGLNVQSSNLRNITPITTAFDDNLVVELFKNDALGKTNLGSWVNVLTDSGKVISMVRTNNSSIGIVGRVDNGISGIKVLSVAVSGEGQTSKYAFKPDSDAIFNGDYPLTLSFYIVIPKDKVSEMKGFVKLLLSQDFAKIIDEAGFYSVPENSRKKSIFSLDVKK